MTLDQIRIFLAVAERGHVTRGAEALRLTQSAVSASIAALEAQHGVRLFDRVGRGIVLTAEGTAFVPTARALLAQAEITIATDERALSEADLEVNFNPLGTPYPYIGGTDNATINDAYPSQINGLVYSRGNLHFENAPTVRGVVLANNTIYINSTKCTANYDAATINNPPPGFNAVTRTMSLTAGSWRRVINP